MKYTIIALLIITLTACSGSDGETPGSKPELGTSPEITATISSYTITGTDTHTPPNPAPIDANISSGNFIIEWNANDAVGNVGQTKLYLSADDTLTTASDVEFFSSLCGIFNDCDENGDAALGCTFTTANLLSCSTDPAIDITTFLTGLPMQAYIILEACKNPWLPADCVNQAAFVEFR